MKKINRQKKEKEQSYEDSDKESQEQVKQIVIERIKQMPSNFQLSLG